MNDVSAELRSSMGGDIQMADGAPAWNLSPSLVMLSNPQGIEAEAVRGLRTRLLTEHLGEGRRAVAVCTPSAGSGCSFIATNLAVAMSQVGVKTVIVEANLRAPEFGDIFGTSEATGLTELLSGRAGNVEDVVIGDVVPNLSVIPAGRVPANPQELLGEVGFRRAAEQLFREYDLTIFDTPPANVCSDAQQVATVAGYAMVVARRHQTRMSDVTTLVKLLRAGKTEVIGTVLNEY